ncbi:hypothetical protein HWV62_34761 [Athelia sp. TMB]|nr:hypothetical protein HWV62_34761 [Athelia sp. TMB]
MASSSTKSKKSRRPNTSAISHPVVEDASSLTALSAFSPQANLFAFLSLAIDKHRLRVYDTLTGKSVAEHIVDDARITTLAWGQIDLSDRSLEENVGEAKKKGKRKRLSNGAALEATPKVGTEVVVLGLSDGTVSFFSPSHGRVLRTLSHTTSTAAILSVVIAEGEDKGPTVWTSGADGSIRVWNARQNTVAGTWKIDDRIPYSSMAIRPASSSTEDGRVDLLVANHGIRLLSVSSGASDSDEFAAHKPKELAKFTGHASNIRNLQWDASTRFLSTADADRFIYVWEVPSGIHTEGKIVLSIPLDSNVRHVSLTSPTSPSTKQTILALSASGKISVYPVPSELTPPASSEKTKHKVPTLIPRSTVNVTSKKTSTSVQVVDASFVAGQEGHIKVARIVGGVRPAFDVARYLDEDGSFIKEVNIIRDDSEVDPSQSAPGAPNKRYTESNSLAVHSGVELGQDQSMDDLALRDVDGDLDVDLAELSLGQRLTALSGADEAADQTSDSDDAAEPTSRRSGKQKAKQEAPSVVPANSLTRTLIQALHSSDSRLLETCLAHSDQSLIRNTVRRLPPQLAVPLLLACVDRLGRGARAANMKGGGGGASSQRGTGLIAWVKAVLAVHSGHLMTMPDLVARLAGLHATLTARLTLQDSLLSLSGRLDMVLSQIEMRSSAAPAPLAPHKGASRNAQSKREVTKYVEGESDDEEDDGMDVEVEVDSGDDAGSIEDVELGGDSQEDDSEEEDDEDEDDDSEDDGPTLNGFVDDEAEEFDDDEDDDESE